MTTPPRPDPSTTPREGSEALRRADTANGESGTTEDDANDLDEPEDEG